MVLGTPHNKVLKITPRNKLYTSLEFFDGNNWNINMKLLKIKCKSDHEFISDEFKQDTDLFLERLSLS